MRIDRFLALALPDFSRSRIQSWIAQGLVLRGGAAAGKSDIIAPGEEVEIDIPEVPAGGFVAAEDLPLVVKYEDEDLLVVEKPAGMPSHTGPGHATGTLVNVLVARYPEIASVGSEKRPGIVHRLDKGTSGLLVVARSPRAYDALSKMVSARAITRVYWAILHGRLAQETGLVEAPIGRDPLDRRRFALRADGKEARTRFTVLARGEKATEIEARLETGRTHQIRVHFASIGHPVVGDPLYAKNLPVPRDEAGEPILARQALHARQLSFRHPFTQEVVEVASDIPEDLARARKALFSSRRRA